MEKKSIKYGKSIIDFTLSYTDRKTLGIKVYPDKSVQVIAPLDTTLNKVLERVRAKSDWILRQKDFFLSFHPLTPPRRYISGETHLYLGSQYRLKVLASSENKVKLQGGNIFVLTKDVSDINKIRKQLRKWYQEKAEIHFNKLFAEALPLAKSIYEGDPTLKHKWMEKRWGSCTKNGTILLNTELIKASKKSIYYVIVHEICHLLHLNHSEEFYKLLNKFYPDWRNTKDELERMMV